MTITVIEVDNRKPQQIENDLLNTLRAEIKRQRPHIDDASFKGAKKHGPNSYILRYAGGTRFMCGFAGKNVYVTPVTRNSQRRAGKQMKKRETYHAKGETNG